MIGENKECGIIPDLCRRCDHADVCSFIPVDLKLIRCSTWSGWRTGDPEEKGRYLVRTKKESYGVAYWRGEWNGQYRNAVEAWRKLPD